MANVDVALESLVELEEVHDAFAQRTAAGARRESLGAVFWICLAWVALTVLLAVLASALPLKNPNFQDYTAVNTGPNLHHLLGTDDLGRDLLSRIIYGSRVSLVIGFASVGLALVTGGALGLLAGYRGKATDLVLNAGSFVVLAFPPLLAILVIEAFWKPTTLWKLVIMFAVAGAPQLFRVIRATTLSFANREFVAAARAMGATTRRILVRELLPNVVPAAISFALIGVAIAIILEGSLAFLGLSITLPTASLGNIVNEGVQNNNLSLNPYIALWPSIYIFLLLAAL
ncbi:MAG TPA: ABC transporter permease, partial [Acidimicrobiales bacterium]|nr:ABC transporter permease [Acidimicrobiales bacterium]